MLTVTEEATSYLARLLSVEGRPDDRVFRLCVDEESLLLSVDRLRADDAAFTHDGKVVLVIDPDVVRLLESRTLGVQSTEMGLQLAVD